VYLIDTDYKRREGIRWSCCGWMANAAS